MDSDVVLTLSITTLHSVRGCPQARTATDRNEELFECDYKFMAG
jgi:hypothetical protein